MRNKILYALALGVLLIPLAVSAATFQGGQDAYTLPSNETIEDDLYAASGNLNSSGTITGDAYLAGGSVTVSGNVGQDLTAVGGQLNLLGNVGDDLRTAGGNITIGGELGSDAVAAGGSIHLLSTATVGGDASLNGGAVTIDGSITGDLNGGSGDLMINGTINGNVSVDTERLVISDSAVINGNLTYAAKESAEISENATILGEITERESKRNYGPAKAGFAGFAKTFAFAKFLSVLTLALILVLVFPKVTRLVVERALNNKGKEFLRGLITLIVTPVVSVILLFTILGTLLGILGLIGYLGLLLIAAPFAGIIFGSWIWSLFDRSEKSEMEMPEEANSKELKVDWKTTLLGVVALGLISLVPVIGWIFWAVFFLMSIGALFYSKYNRLWDIR